MNRRWPILLLLLSALAGFVGGTAAPEETVTLTVYFGAHSRPTLERKVPFRPGLTVMQATQAALQVETNPEQTFVKAIEGVANSDERKEYWLYFVNGQMLPVSAASRQLRAGDRVLWFLRRSGAPPEQD